MRKATARQLLRRNVRHAVGGLASELAAWNDQAVSEPKRRRGRSPLDDVEVDARAAEVRVAAEAVASARDQAQQAEQRLALLLVAQWQEGLTWKQLADAAASAGITSAEAARTFAAVRTRGAVDADSVGVSVSEAANFLGVQRATVYARIDRGTLRSVVDEKGRTRVLLDD